MKKTRTKARQDCQWGSHGPRTRLACSVTATRWGRHASVLQQSTKGPSVAGFTAHLPQAKVQQLLRNFIYQSPCFLLVVSVTTSLFVLFTSWKSIWSDLRLLLFFLLFAKNKMVWYIFIHVVHIVTHVFGHLLCMLMLLFFYFAWLIWFDQLIR